MKKYSTKSVFGLIGAIVDSSFILHIPHSSINIPNWTGFNIDEPELIDNELLKMTDWDTDRIFNVPGITQVKAEFSRLFCDVERFFPDEQEVMSSCGRGFFYTKTDNGNELREDVGNIKDQIHKNYYQRYHENLNRVVKSKLDNAGMAYIIDCHSFNNELLNTDIDKSLPRPDICIGTDYFHTPDHLLELVQSHFERKNYSVKINSPYSGTIVPTEYYRKNEDVYSIMIEINKRLYMDGYSVDLAKVIQLNKVIQGLFADFE